MPLRNHLEVVLNRPSFDNLCSQWKTSPNNEAIYKDVFDGKIWREFQCYEGKPFLSEPFTYGLMMNIDWFQPCKHTEYSVGAIYLTFMNLPRKLRFRQENVLLIGLLPGPKEPKRDINAFLAPLVEELQSLLDGVEIYIRSLSKAVLVRCALLCVACDIPASRKVSGFLGHSATLGCSKCMKVFPGQVGRKDYSGFDRSQWKERTLDNHKKCIHLIRKCKTKRQRNDLESKYGCRYSILLDLPYFNPIRMTIIDPMHNLYLGTAKHVLKDIWLERGLIDHKSLDCIQSKVDSISKPHYIGRIPRKIASSFAGFTADQYKNWTNLFSVIALHDILTGDHLKCWYYFVQASRLLCQMSITDAQIQLADAFLLKFCHRVENLYGKNLITPNMHLHCHLKQCLLDYGPVHNFWLFSFERYNGILENFPSNNRSIEIHLMRRFIHECSLYTSCHYLPTEYKAEFGALISKDIEPLVEGSLQATIHGKSINRCDPRKVTDWSFTTSLEVLLPKSYHRSTLSTQELSQLHCMYVLLYPNEALELSSLNSVCKVYSSITYNGIRHKAGSIMYATVYTSHSFNPTPRPLLLNKFFIHSCELNGRVILHLFAMVSWLKEHHAKNKYVKPFELWWKDIYDTNVKRIIPIQLLICHSVHCDVKFEEETLFLMCPVENI